MKNYKYVAVNLQKKKFSGVFMAEDERDLAAQLARQNLFLVSAKPYSSKTPSAFFTTGTGKVSVQELSTFSRQFAIMITAGIPIVGCIESLKDQPFSSFFKSLLQVIYEDVKSGVQLSECLNKHDKVFPPFFRSMIYVGEASGKLDMVLNSLADYFEKDTAMRSKIKSAFSYPIMLGVMTVGIVIAMLVFIIPIFKGTLEGLEIVPTGFTKVVYDTSDWLTANWYYALGAIIAVGIAIFIYGKTKSGTSFFDKLKINAPLIGKITMALACSRFARSFSLLLSSGMDISASLEVVTVVIDNTDLKRRFIEAAEEVKHGAGLAKSFQKYKLFPAIMIQMVAIGEKTATLDEVLFSSCSYFDEQAEKEITSTTSVIQPIMLCIMGAVIGALFLAIYSPMLAIMTGM